MEEHEMRFALSLNEAGQLHLAIYATDAFGQWFHLDDWTCDNAGEIELTLDLVLNDLRTWLTFAGEALPA